MRDYNKELEDNSRKYGYNFDFDVMHPLMLRAFKPFFKNGSVLELGNYMGAFTTRLLDEFNEVTCIEASEDACRLTKNKFKNVNVNIINSTFEDADIDAKFDNIILTHVLEHIDDRVGLLKKVKDEWLSEDGVFFIACPNANAPSRQIAVKMGLVDSNNSVTEAERQHGHRITYSLDTLSSDIKKAGLTPMHCSGIFFKALANFQWDKMLELGIVDENYIEGCYQLGLQYPELCSSIFFVCKK